MESSDPSPNSSPNSLKQKIRSSLCFSCCFPSPAGEDERPLSLVKSSSMWIRSKAQELPEEFEDKCRNLVAGIKRHHLRRHHCGGPFRYDPVSYAQNFDQGRDYDDGYFEVGAAAGEFRLRNFSSRLPASRPAAVEVK